MLNGYFEDSDNTEMNFEGTEHVDKITVIPIDKDDVCTILLKFMY